MAQNANNVFRDFTTDGVPSSGAHNPKKAEIREWGTYLETFISAAQAGAAVFASKAALDAALAYAANTMAWVIGESTVANNGIYRKLGGSGSGSWSRVADLPYSFIRAADVGAGTANAVVATTSIPLPSSAYAALILMNVFEANTGAVTVSINGATAKPLVTNGGNPLAADYLKAGMLAAFVDDGANYRLITDVVSSAIIAAAEASAAAAAASETLAAGYAAGVNLPPILPGDAGKQLAARGDETGYELVDGGSDLGIVNVIDGGAAGDGAADDATALNAAITAGGIGASLFFPEGTFKVGASLIPVPGTPGTFVAPINMLTHAEDFTNAAWDKSPASAIVVANAERAPNGELTADKLIEGTVSSTHRWRQSKNFTTGLPYTMSGYFKPSGRDRVFFVLPTTRFPAGANALFNVSTGVVETTGADATAAITNVGGGWYRCSITATATSTGLGDVDFRLHNGTSQTYIGDGVQAVFGWGALLQQAGSASAYYDADFFGPLSRQKFVSVNPWSSTIKAGAVDKVIFSLENAGGTVIERLGITHGADPAFYTGATEAVALLNDFYQSNDVAIRFNVFDKIARQAISVRYGDRWSIIGNQAYDLGREFFSTWFSSSDHIVALNHVRNPGDDTIALNADHSVVLGNHVSYDGPNHNVTTTGGGPLKIRGNYNNVQGNVFRDVNAWFLNFYNGNNADLSTTSPTGNIFANNVCDGTKLRPSNADSMGLFILRPTNGGFNVIKDNVARGLLTIDAINWQPTTNSAPDTGGTYLFEGNVFHNMRFAAILHASGGRIVFKNCRFYGIAGDYVLATKATGAIAFSEIVFEDCEFEFTAGSAKTAIIRSSNPNFTCNRSIVKRCRVLNAGASTVAVSLAGGATITTKTVEGNDAIT